jgi:hypothetical protein
MSQNKPTTIDHVRKARLLPGNGEKSIQCSISNVFKESLQTTTNGLAERGWSQRRIASELGINRETVGRYLRLGKAAISTTGIGAGRRSHCEPLTEVIAANVGVASVTQDTRTHI